jgi:hypothetical protein
MCPADRMTNAQKGKLTAMRRSLMLIVRTLGMMIDVRGEAFGDSRDAHSLDP